jgi:hypothetical protein
MSNYEERNYPTKITSHMFENYFNMFAEDSGFGGSLENTKFDPNSLKYEDFCSLEFWSNIFGNYTDVNMADGFHVLNETGFVELVKTNKYFKSKYSSYLNYSNFEDLDKIDTSSFTNSSLTDYDFLTDFSLNLLETKSKHFMKKKSSVFDKLEATTKTSLYSMNLDDVETSEEDKHLDRILKSYFKMLDLDSNKFLTFEEFMIFIKYIQAYDRLNMNNSDKRGIISSNCVNSKSLFIQ